MTSPDQRDDFATRWGFILACAGSAVGLGNLWMFPWRLGEYGGAAFLIPYLIFVYLLGTTGLMGEFAFGRWAKKGAMGAYDKAMRSAPAQVQLILSDLCNHDCSFCAYRLSGYTSNMNFADVDGNKNPRRMIPTEKALEIVKDCSTLGVQGLQFTGGGEPTVHPDHLHLARTQNRQP